jgi:hypothetical protein
MLELFMSEPFGSLEVGPSEVSVLEDGSVEIDSFETVLKVVVRCSPTELLCLSKERSKGKGIEKDTRNARRRSYLR